MNKNAVVQGLLADKFGQEAPKSEGSYFAPSNIALIKYWGKRDLNLNLPCNSSLSIGLGHLGAKTHLSYTAANCDEMYLNNELVAESSAFYVNAKAFLDLSRPLGKHYRLQSQSNIPVAAGLASSACGFAALSGSLNEMYNWQLNPNSLSILARLGSGSACRSFWPGFVEWQQGKDPFGMDSYASPLTAKWPELCLGILIVNQEAKALSSRKAMQHTQANNPWYRHWPEAANSALVRLKRAIQSKDFESFGAIAEHNAQMMHALIQSTWPPMSFHQAATTQHIQRLWALRAEGLPLYYTQDAGPNLKLLFEQKDAASVQANFPNLQIIQPFNP